MISVTILTKNSQKYLREVLDALVEFEEVVIYDNGSTDATLEIIKEYSNITLYQGLFLGFGATHNYVSSLARYDWILSIDSDEVVSPALLAEIKQLKLAENTVYSLSRHNEFNGKFIWFCGWYPDRVVRLYHRQFTKFSADLVHEAIEIENMQKIALNAPLRHYSYSCVADFITKMQAYSDLFAQQNAHKKSSSPLKALLHAKFAFLRNYFLKGGILGGYEGFLISFYNAHTTFYKYLKLYEANNHPKKPH